MRCRYLRGVPLRLAAAKQAAVAGLKTGLSPPSIWLMGSNRARPAMITAMPAALGGTPNSATTLPSCAAVCAGQTSCLRIGAVTQSSLSAFAGEVTSSLQSTGASEYLRHSAVSGCERAHQMLLMSTNSPVTMVSPSTGP